MKVSRKLYAHLYRLTWDLKWEITYCLTDERRVQRSSHVWVQEKLERDRYRGGCITLKHLLRARKLRELPCSIFFRHVTPQISSWLQTFLTFLNHQTTHTIHKWNAKYTLTTVHTNSRKRLRNNVMWRIIFCSTSTIPPLWFLCFSVLSFVSACLGNFIRR